MKLSIVSIVLAVLLPFSSLAFTTQRVSSPLLSTPVIKKATPPSGGQSPRIHDTQLYDQISKKRREELGIPDGEDEYDLYKALENNTDPLISKIVAGSFILVMISLLVVGVIIPYTTDYGEGVCNPILTAGRC